MTSISNHSKVYFVWRSYITSDSSLDDHCTVGDSKQQQEDDDQLGTEEGNQSDVMKKSLGSDTRHKALHENALEMAKPHITQTQVSTEYEHDIEKKMLHAKIIRYELMQSKISSSIENQGFLSCPVCMEKYNGNKREGVVDLTVPIHSQACDHTICYGCICRMHQIQFKSSQQLRWLKCPICKAQKAFQPQRPIVSRITMELIRIQESLNGIVS